MLCLTTQGLALEVFDVITSKLLLKKNESENVIDSALLRYFISGAVEIMRPPFSISLVRSFGKLLCLKSCVTALQNSPYFKTDSLRNIIAFMKQTIETKNDTTKRDRSLVAALVSNYAP